MGERILNHRHSSHYQETAKSSTNGDVYLKSDLKIGKHFVAVCSDHTVYGRTRIPNDHSVQGEYYKRYEHDEVPIKDTSTDNSNYTIPKKNSLTNSDLQKIEKRISINVSEKLQPDNESFSSLESNIKFFKTTVEKIFDSFYADMRDYEHYKKRFNDILEKNQEGSLNDMEDFITDMFEHIMSSHNSGSNISRFSAETFEKRDKKAVSSFGDTYTEPNTSAEMLAYKNNNYLTDSTIDEDSSKGKCRKIEEILNITLMDDIPFVKIKMNDRNLLSEINIREPIENLTGSIASADNLKSVAAKRLEVERYIKQQNHNSPDKYIPVRVSFPKKNIYLNEDFARNDNRQNPKSLISKICNILCKKFRRSSFG